MPEVPFQGPQNWSPLAPGAPPAANAEDAWFTGSKPGTVGNRLAPSGADHGGSIPLADLLSHGVEQEPAAGLTAGPMGAPAQQGVPFRRDPAQLAGDLALEDHFTPQGAANNRDVAGVMSQGVPNDEMARAEPSGVPTHHGITHAADETGVHTVTSPDGESIAVESGPYLVEKRTDTAPDAQGQGQGGARLLRLAEVADSMGKRLASDISVSPDAERMWRGLQKKGYRIQVNPNATRASTGNLVSDDPRKPVFIAVPRNVPLEQALGGY